MYIHKLLFTAMVLCSLLCPWGAGAAGITNYPPLVNPAHWTAQNAAGDQVILDSKGVSAFNAKVRSASRTVPDLVNYPASMSGDSLKTKIMDYSVLDDDLYLHGNKVSENYKDILRKQTNISAVTASVKVRYGVTVRRTAVRALPTGEGLYYYAADTDFDALQQTMLDPGESVAVLHTSANGYFYYVQAVNYSGWVSKFNVALAEKKDWLAFAKPESFLVVTAAGYTLKTAGENVLYQQGARLPVESVQGDVYTVLAPVRASSGTLQKQKLFVPKSSAGVHYGYLPYTSNNIINAAFKFYGQPYGWGGLKNSVDCSSLVFNAYRTVGIILPRDADQQEQGAGTRHALSGDDKTRKQQINKLLPGAALYMDGHVLIYIGQINGEPYAIHALGSHYANGQSRKEMKVVVSDLNLKRASGQTHLQALTSAIEYK